MELTFRGAGPSGGGGDDFVTRPDNLRSDDTFEGLLGLCVGPIKGPVNGMKNVRLNDTPIQDQNDKDNFQDFTAVFADGDPLKFPQICTLRLGAAGSPDNISLQIGNLNSSGPGPWVTHTVNDMNAEAIDLRFVVGQLYKQSESGIGNATATLEVQMKPSGTATWINPLFSNGNTVPPFNPAGSPVESGFGAGVVRVVRTLATHTRAAEGTLNPNFRITGKTTSSPYVKEYRVKVPYTGNYANKTWDIRVRLIEKETVDQDKNQERRQITWESATPVFHGTVGDHEDWRGVAWLQLYGKATDQLNGVPDVSGIYDTKIVSVPPSTVFNPDTRQYTGAIWDGSWAKAYTNDPAWVINDAISDSLSGLARLVPGAHLNKWDALELSKYASELVPDGAGGTQPRFSLNLAVTEPQRSDEFIRFMAGAAASTAWDNGDGEWRCVTDKPRVPSAIFTHENIEGEFVYSHTDVDTRFNEVTVTFLNEEFDFREDRVKLEDPDHIAKFGRKPTKVVAIGCTNRQQAIRWAILKLRSNVNEFRANTFTTNRQGKLLERFGWILVADGSLNQTLDDEKRTTGRIIENKGGSIVLRDTVRIEIGVPYKIHATVPNPNYTPELTSEPTNPTWQQPTITISRTVTNTNGQRGDVRELFLDQPLPADVATNANIGLEAVGLPSTPKVYRVLDVTYADEGERVTVNTIEVDTAKYQAADLADYDYNMPGYGPTPTLIPPPVPPSTGMVSLVATVVTATATNRQLRADWQRPSYPLVKGYRVERRYNDGPWENIGFTTELQYEEMNPVDGFYEFRVYTVDQKDRESLPLEDNIAVGVLPQFAPTGFLTNESHTVAAAPDGTGFSLTKAGGQFILYSPSGQIVEDLTFEVYATSGCTATIDANGLYAITALNADVATATFRAHWFGYTVEKIYSISKSKAGQDGDDGGDGVDGNDALLLYVISDRQTIQYDGAGSPAANQTTTFTAQRVNTAANVTWSITDINGVAQPANKLTVAANTLSATLTEANFASARNGTAGVIVKGTLTDQGLTLSDQISVVRVGNGANGNDGGQGPAGPTISLVADDLSFDFIDGYPVSAAQVITLTATKQNTAEAISWSASPAVTLGGTAGASVRTLSLTDFGSNSQVTITVTGAVSGAKASVTLIRSDQTTPDDSIIPDSRWMVGRQPTARTLTDTPWRYRTGAIRINLV